MPQIVRVLVLGSLTLLAACSGEPSETEMKKAVAKTASAQLAQFAGVFGSLAGKPGAAAQKPPDVDSLITKFVKDGCVKPASQPGYVCDFTFTVQGVSQHGKGRFFDTSDGLGFEEMR